MLGGVAPLASELEARLVLVGGGEAAFCGGVCCCCCLTNEELVLAFFVSGSLIEDAEDSGLVATLLLLLSFDALILDVDGEADVSELNEPEASLPFRRFLKPDDVEGGRLLAFGLLPLPLPLVPAVEGEYEESTAEEDDSADSSTDGGGGLLASRRGWRGTAGRV